MKCLTIALLWIIVQVQCHSRELPKLKDIQESEKNGENQRSARVHRVSTSFFPENPELYAPQKKSEEMGNYVNEVDDLKNFNVKANEIKDMIAEKKPMVQQVGNVKDLRVSPDELKVYYNDDSDKEKYLKSGLYGVVKPLSSCYIESINENEKVSKYNKQILSEMLINVQNEISRLKNSIEEPCRHEFLPSLLGYKHLDKHLSTKYPKNTSERH